MSGERRAGADAIATARTAALWFLAVIIAAASVVGFAESYRGLFEWAGHHGLAGFWADVWPLQVDVFIAAGEVALFVGIADRWPVRARVGAWILTGAGLAVSIAGNVGHVTGHSLSNRVTAAIPPIAAAAALAVGMGVFKRVVAEAPAPGRGLAVRTVEDAAALAYQASVDGGNPLSDRALAGRFGISRRAAGQVISRMASVNGGPVANGRSPSAE